MDPNIVQKVTVFALPVLLAITLHEAAHGYTARHFGDNTAAEQGRLTLNPLKHIDPVGTVLVPLLTLIFTPFIFGWASTPVDFGRLRKRSDRVWVTAAGPLANLAMALGWALIYKIARELPPDSMSMTWLLLVSAAGIFVNALFFAFNLIPLPPLDGGRILMDLLPPSAAVQFARIEPFGFIILLLLMITGILGAVLWPAIMLVARAVCALAGISGGEALAGLMAL